MQCTAAVVTHRQVHETANHIFCRKIARFVFTRNAEVEGGLKESVTTTMQP